MFALQEDLQQKEDLLQQKDEVLSSMQREREQLLSELEELQARVGGGDGEESKKLMDMAAMELAKLKTHNHDLTMQLASAQEQLDILTQSQEGMPAAAPLGDGMVLHSSALSAEQAAGDGAQGIATSLREEMRMRQHCEQRLAEAQQQIADRTAELEHLHDTLGHMQGEARQQHATLRQLELDLIVAQERQKQSEEAARESAAEGARLSGQLHMANAEISYLQGQVRSEGGGRHVESGGDLAVLEASLHQVQKPQSLNHTHAHTPTYIRARAHTHTHTHHITSGGDGTSAGERAVARAPTHARR